MKLIADLQIHSRFSRATSSSLNLPNLEKYAKLKGLNLLGTGDFTHPKWLAELKNELKEDGSGILASKSGFHFVLQGEISNIYTQDGKGRRIHNLLLARNFEVVEQINSALLKKGRLDYDGRPIFGFSCIELVEMMKEIDDEIEIIPAHCLLPGTIIHSNPKLMPIEHLKNGDKVLTHKSKYRKVKAIHNRHYKGDIYHIKPRYFSLGLNTTEEHPFFAIKTLKDCSWTSGICKPTYPHIKRCVTNAYQKYEPRWIQAKNLEVGDVLLYPRLTSTKDVKYVKIGNDNVRVDEKFCRLIGYYLAEGYTNGRDCIGFSFNKEETQFLNDVRYLISEVLKYKSKEGKTFGDILVYSNRIRLFFEENFYCDNQKRASSKSMPYWMLKLPLKKQVEILKGWWYGDRGSTSSRTLMNQFKIICLRLGVVPSIRVDTKDSHILRGKHILKNRIITAQSDNYILDRLTFFEDKFNLLKNEYFRICKPKKEMKYGWIDNKYVYLPIFKIIKKHYEGYVYNLEVEEDNSYVAEFAAIHNCWTPWYGIFGSMSGFDSVEECFKEKSKHIYAIETGLSSDPAMNWRLSKLDKYTLLSSSDAHSFWPWRLGREANVFDMDWSYDDLLQAIRKRKGFVETIEMWPHEGKYHYTGHRNCNVCLSPKESIELKNICPKCRTPLTVGVAQRVEMLADREEGFVPENAVPFKNLIPLSEVIAGTTGHAVSSKQVWEEYYKLINEFGNEFNILLEAEETNLKKITSEKIANNIIKNRNQKIPFKPGYDGVYGVPIFNDKYAIKIKEQNNELKIKQKGLDEFM
ncbi:hypothetical protein HYX04_03075 [Candidatus Woesearchaeota archaeon]|nr:hypothetical protein [Candidatus Woesearchaeota archaeon]